jgi:adenosylcobinamide-phosphate synthase
MDRRLLLAAAFLVDRFAGDPEWFPHPVRIIGLGIARGEDLLRWPDQSGIAAMFAGAALTTTVVAVSYQASDALINTARRFSPRLSDFTELLLAWTCLAARNLEQESTAVLHALRVSDLPLARSRLSRIVGRDTAHLDPSEISRAAIETVAESFSDGIVAPLFYLALGGVPLAMAYKAINTLDSMIGHTDPRFFYFGKAAARLDDAANLLPSRCAATFLVAAASLSANADPHSAWRVWQRDGAKHKSPNAGRPESAMAGALQVALGGRNTYAGEIVPSPRLGAEFTAATPEKVGHAIRLVALASLFCLAAAIVVSSLPAGRRR